MQTTLKAFVAFLKTIAEMTASKLDDEAVRLLEIIASDSELIRWLRDLIPAIKAGFSPTLQVNLPPKIAAKFAAGGVLPDTVHRAMPFLVRVAFSAEAPNEPLPVEITSALAFNRLPAQDSAGPDNVA